MAILFKDTFTDVDATVLTAHTPDIATSGLAWAMMGTSVGKIISNQAYLNPSNSYNPAYVQLATQSFAVQCVFANVVYLDMMVLRFQDTSNWLGVFRSTGSGQLLLRKRVASVVTDLWDSGAAFVNGDTIRAEHDGSTIRVYINGVLKATVTGVTDFLSNTYMRPGITGADATPSAARWDDFQIEDLATGSVTFTGSGTASGTSTVSATSTLRKQSAGTSSGTSQDSATPVYRRSAVGTSSGIATTSASIGIITQHASGTSSGVTTASATPIQRRQALGTSSGVASNTAVPNFRRSVSVIANGSSWTYISAPSSGTSDVYYYRKKMISRFGLLK